MYRHVYGHAYGQVYNHVLVGRLFTDLHLGVDVLVLLGYVLLVHHLGPVHRHCTGMCTGVCIDMCIDMCIACAQKCV